MSNVNRHWGNTNKANTRLYKIWSYMKNRCNNPNSSYYYRYGGRGIHYWYTWENFEVFAMWAFNNGYNEHLTLDRIDNNKGYSPLNCRWVTTKIQNRNTSQNIIITFNNKTQCLTDWAKDLGMNRAVLNYRIKKGWSIEKAFTEPINKNKSRGGNEN